MVKQVQTTSIHNSNLKIEDEIKSPTAGKSGKSDELTKILVENHPTIFVV
jgi:hypothetical protein